MKFGREQVPTENAPSVRKEISSAQRRGENKVKITVCHISCSVLGPGKREEVGKGTEHLKKMSVEYSTHGNEASF